MRLNILNMNRGM